MKSFIPVFITKEGGLPDLIKSIRATGYHMDDSDLVMTLPVSDDGRLAGCGDVSLYSIGEALGETIFEYMQANAYFSVVICSDIMTADIVSFFNDIMPQISDTIGLEIVYSFSTPDTFMYKVMRVIRGLVIGGPAGSGKTLLAMKLSEKDHFVAVPCLYTGACKVRGESASLFGDTVDMTHLDESEFDELSDSNQIISIVARDGFGSRRKIGWRAKDVMEIAMAGKIPVFTCSSDAATAISSSLVNLTRAMLSVPMSVILNKMKSNGMKPPGDHFISEFLFDIYRPEDFDIVYSPSEEQLTSVSAFVEGFSDLIVTQRGT